MEAQKVELTCEVCSRNFEILVKNYDGYVQEDCPILCTECFEETVGDSDVVSLPKRDLFEYMVTSCENFVSLELETTAFNIYGQNGWELIQIINNKVYFKREHVEGSK